MSGPRKTLDELIANALERQERSRADVADLRTRARILDRKKDAHRKVVAGATLLARVKANPHLRRAVHDDFNRAVIDPKRRAVIPDLLDEQAFQEAMRAAADKAAIEAKEEAEMQPTPPMRPLKAPGETPSGAAPS